MLLGVAQANHRLENYGAAAKSYKRLKEIDAQLAGQSAYLDLRGEEAARAADVAGVKGAVAWKEE